MKNLLAAFLATLLFLPACGSVLASAANAIGASVGHHSEAMSVDADGDMGKMDMASNGNASVAESPVCEHPHVGDSPTLDCCTSGHSQYFIGTPETRPTEKLLKTTTVSFLFANAVSDSDILPSSSNYPSTAPPLPDKQTYTSLVGIVKRLD